MSIHYSIPVKQVAPDSDSLLVEEVNEKEIEQLNAALQRAGYKIGWDTCDREPVLVTRYSNGIRPMPLENALHVWGTYELVQAVLQRVRQ